ncbi:hypothetical protein EsDP_00006409 [Epichloe bromicola]|uniref:Autophagy-related protein 1 n=1 Tax=Epichloe bromicola TaxID=79588 RepID=A0ABQ0CXI0_9HYPO
MAWTLFTVSAENHIVFYSHNAAYRSTNNVHYIEDVFAIGSPSEYSESGTPAPQPALPSNILRFATDHMPKDPSAGFVFGVDRDNCDILLHVNRETGISGKQFAVTFRADTGAIVLKNLSRAGTMVHINMEFIRLQTQRVIEKLDHVFISLADFRIGLFLGSDGDIDCQYVRFLAKLGSIPPNLSHMRLESSASTSLSENPRSNPYRLGRVLGQGASAIVYEAFHKSSGDLVAVKCFASDSRFGNPWKESSILCSLQHLCKFNDREGRTIINQILEGLKYLHEKGVIHRDLKPGNILVTTRQPIHIKVADFGISSKVADMHNTMCGTCLYAAPEIWTPPYTEKIDIWSVGIIVLELWAGLPVYHKDTWTQRNFNPQGNSFARCDGIS